MDVSPTDSNFELNGNKLRIKNVQDSTGSRAVTFSVDLDEVTSPRLENVNVTQTVNTNIIENNCLGEGDA